MRARIVRIGNSQGVRIPKPLLEETGLDGEVEIEVNDNTLVIRTARPPRSGWDETFAAMAVADDDALLDAGTLPCSTWDEEEWEW